MLYPGWDAASLPPAPGSCARPAARSRTTWRGRLYLQMQVGHGRVAGIADQRRRIALPDPIPLADSQRPVAEVRQDDEVAALDLDDDDVPRRVFKSPRGVGAFGVLHVARSPTGAGSNRP